MTRETFEQILKDNKILWNSLVKLEVFNPNHRRSIFRKIPKTMVFEGALGYHKGDKYVDLWVDGDEPLNTKVLYFDFEQIVGVTLINEKH